MEPTSLSLANKVAIVTGAAQRVGSVIVRTLHAEGMNILLHYRSSEREAQAIYDEIQGWRKDSVALAQADLLHAERPPELVQRALDMWGRLDVLVNNASSFYPTPVGTVTLEQWEELLGSNVKAPFFLAQAAAPHLAETSGCIVNIADIYADRPLRSYPVYSIAKAAVVMMTKALARELAPEVRVNAVAPGAILWPDDMDDATKKRILSRIALRRQGEPADIARAVRFLVKDAGYVTGQVLAVDGGRSIYA